MFTKRKKVLKCCNCLMHFVQFGTKKTIVCYKTYRKSGQNVYKKYMKCIFNYKKGSISRKLEFSFFSR